MKENFMNITLSHLHNSIIEMMTLCENQIESSIDCMMRKDLNLAQEIIENDKNINSIRSDLINKSIELIVLKQPMAIDMRAIYATIMTCMFLERIGDYCVDIANEVIDIGSETYIKELVDLPKMGSLCLDMFKITKQSLIDEDTQNIYKMGEKDDAVDDIYKKIRLDLIEKMKEDENNIEQAEKLLFISRYLERIADHITNICEQIIYKVDGKLIEIG
ncbi:MAG: phosphate signaling complex protein PhoU [Clostridioides sp.]|jgi:phosphate transport system protein|nr:phosphate signaling complex protein PhoU [Clostridioides sp.]